ncbi:hypothetical protein F5Y06DRAFT_276695 [Hypoxylon sp. FL0890]|nr:hypothetical protein F5Y06DRAFT_276695 [Hypoxylon sp. FL0890]
MSSSASLSPEIAAQDKGPSIVVVSCVVTSITTLFVAARLYVRGVIQRKLQLDDALIVISLICGWLTVAFAVASVASGNGKHIAVLNAEQISGAVLWTMVGFVPGVLSFSIPKLAAIYLLTRLLEPSKRHRTLLWTMGVLCVLILTGCIAILFGQCTPSRAQWDLTITEKTCINPYILVDYSIFAGAFSGALDLYLALYPAIVLFSLQLNKKKKIALSAALGLGSVACIVAIYKTTRIPGLASSDFTYDTSDLTIWTCVEGGSVIIATCIPVLRPLVEVIFGRRVLGSSGDRKYYKNYGTSRSATKDEMELSSRKRRVKGPYDLETNIDVAAKDGSQEEILPRDGDPSAKRADGIVRTQEVTIDYGDDKGSTDGLKKYENWNR